MEIKSESESFNYGTKEWLKTEIDDKNKKEEEGRLSLQEQQRSSYQDVQPTCPVGYLYRRGKLDTEKNKLIQKMLNLMDPLVKRYVETIKTKIGKVTKNELQEIELFAQAKLTEQTQHLVGFFDSPKTAIVENEEIKEIRENVNIKEQILKRCFNFDDITGELVSTNNITHEELMDELYDKGEGMLATIIENTARSLTSGEFFKVTGKDVVDLRHTLFDGRIYAPPQAEHNWPNNLAWLLAHIHKGDTMLIFSEVTPDLLKRQTQNYENELSGFSREIALLRKLGYNFTKVGDHYQATPPVGKEEYLSNLTMNKALMSDAKVEKYYNKVIKSLTKKETLEIAQETKQRKSGMTTSGIFADSPVKKIKRKIPDFALKNVENLAEQKREKKTKPKKTKYENT